MNNFDTKNIFKYIIVVGFLFLIIWLLVFKSNKAEKVNNLENKIEFKYISRLKIKDTSINVEIVNTPEDLARGLSGRANLAENQGMLFDFARPGIYPFWMKDMNFPIDIIWINEKDLTIIYIKENATPESYPESFSPKENAGYVLEVHSGFTKKHNIQIGDKIIFE